ncbi:MAG: hypothetical protein FWH42_06105, partial [Dehalococcoidia bacterium]|nr:hypothetical protein [Dehalococcoidia bacterium]
CDAVILVSDVMVNLHYGLYNFFGLIGELFDWEGSVPSGFEIRTNDDDTGGAMAAYSGPGGLGGPTMQGGLGGMQLMSAQAAAIKTTYLGGKEMISYKAGEAVRHVNVAVDGQASLYATLKNSIFTPGNEVKWIIDNNRLKYTTRDDLVSCMTDVNVDVEFTGRRSITETPIRAELWRGTGSNKTRVDWAEATVSVVEPLDNANDIIAKSDMIINWTPIDRYNSAQPKNLSNTLKKGQSAKVIGEVGKWWCIKWTDGTYGFVETGKSEIDRFRYDWNRPIHGDMSDAVPLSAEFLKKVVEICDNLGFDPDDLMTLMAEESHFQTGWGKYNPNAVGLIQFTDTAVADLNQNAQDYGLATTSMAALSTMSAVNQLDYVWLRFRSAKDKPKYSGMHTLEDIIVYNFLPAKYEERNPLTAQGQPGYKDQKVWDANNDGIITCAEAIAWFHSKRDMFYKKP